MLPVLRRQLVKAVTTRDIDQLHAEIGRHAPIQANRVHTGDLRGYRTTLLTDLDLGTRPARAVGNAVVASVLGDPMIYVSAGWGFHQGPMGGGVVAVILRLGDTQRN